MPDTITISLDAMGGDNGPNVAIAGAAIAIERRPDLRFLIYGEEHAVRPVLEAYPRVRDRSAFTPLQRERADARQAESGAQTRPLEVVDVAVRSRR